MKQYISSQIQNLISRWILSNYINVNAVMSITGKYENSISQFYSMGENT